MKELANKTFPAWILFILVPVLIGASVLATVLIYRNSAAKDEQQLVQRVKDEVLKELRPGQQPAVDPKQQAEANLEKERLANEKAKAVRPVIKGRDHIYGDADAPISLIEYSDSECPFCKTYHPVPKQIVDSYKGKVNLVYRHFPLKMHDPLATKQAEASECAGEIGGNDAFWKYLDAIYARTKSGGSGFPVTALTPLATELGLNTDRFQQCFESGKHSARVKEDLNSGTQIGITGTPATVLLNNKTGETIIRTGNKAAALRTAIDKML